MGEVLEVIEQVYEILMLIFLKGNMPESNSYLRRKAELRLEGKLAQLKSAIKRLKGEE